MRRTIKYAVRNLKPDVKESMLRAWKASGCMDLYDGDLALYIQVIAQQLELKNNQLVVISKGMVSVIKELNDGLDHARRLVA